MAEIAAIRAVFYGNGSMEDAYTAIDMVRSGEATVADIREMYPYTRPFWTGESRRH